MNEMVERVAAALDKAAIEWCAKTQEGMADMPAELLAQAAIEAMREPTQDMVWEGESAASLYLCKPQNDEGVPHVWREMIRAALR